MLKLFLRAVYADLLMRLKVTGLEDAAVMYNTAPDLWVFKAEPFTYVDRHFAAVSQTVGYLVGSQCHRPLAQSGSTQ